MKLKVMVTGKNRKIASDICEHLTEDRDYKVIKCASTKSALFETAIQEMPHVIIICLGNESKDTVKAFDTLKECSRTGMAEILVVANDEDKKIFISNTKLAKMFFLSRPVSLLALYRKLDEAEEKMEDVERISEGLIEEYINPDPVEEFPRKHILVVDDDPEQLMAIKENLREFYEVSVLNGGKNIIKFLKKFKVDLIFLDYLMPEIDGPEVLITLKAYPEFRDIPIVFLTGVSEKEIVLKTIVELKPQGYILKPAKKSELVAKIIDVLG